MTLTLADLTPRQRDVAVLYRQGFSAKYIAERLHLSKRTVETHMWHIYDKYGVHSRDALIETLRGEGDGC